MLSNKLNSSLMTRREQQKKIKCVNSKTICCFSIEQLITVISTISTFVKLNWSARWNQVWIFLFFSSVMKNIYDKNYEYSFNHIESINSVSPWVVNFYCNDIIFLVESAKDKWPIHAKRISTCIPHGEKNAHINTTQQQQLILTLIKCYQT